MEKENRGVLQTSEYGITLVVSKAPICSPIVETIPAGRSYHEIVESIKGISPQHTKVFQDGVVVEDWSAIPEGGNVAVAQMPSGLSPIVVAAIVSAVVGAVVGFLMYESPETVSEQEKQRRVQGDRNSNKGYEPLPYILGRRKVVPAYAAYPYTKWVGQQQYYFMLLHIGYGPLKIEDIKIGDVSVDNFDSDTEYAWVDWYENIDVGALKQIWSKDTSQTTLNQEVPRVDNYLTSAIPVGVGKTEVVYNFPQGLVWQAGRGPVSVSASIQFQYQGSDGDWYTPVRYIDFDGKVSGYMPPGAVIKNRTSSRDWFLAGNSSTRKWFQNESSGRNLSSSEVIYDDGRGNAIIKTSGSEFIASRSHVNKSSSSFTSSIAFDVSKAGSPDEDSPIAFRARHSTEENLGKKPVIDRVDIFTITRSAPISDIDFEDVIALPKSGDNPNVRQAVLALKIRASEQLTGTVDDLNVIATSVVPTDPSKDWRNWWSEHQTGSLPNTVPLTETSNPSDLYRWVLQGPMNPARVGNSKIDLDAISDWKQTCISEGWETSALMNEATNLKDTLSNIAKTGRAQFSMRNGIFSVVENIERTIPVQVFTPKNSRDFSSKRVFPDPSDGITIEFQNENEDFEVDEWTYYDPTISVGDRVGQTDSMEMWGIAKPQLAQKHARFAYFEKQLRRETYTLTTDIEGLVCERGSLVRVAHDVVDIGLGQGFIKSVDGNSFTLDETKDLVSGNTYGITVRSVSNGVAIETVQATYNGGGEWTATSSPGAGLNIGDLVSYGELGNETLDCIVQEITYNNQYDATLTLVNAANEIYTYDGDGLPPYETALTPRPDRFPPAAPTVSVSAGSSSYNNPTLKVVVSNSTTEIANISQYKLQYRIADTFWEDGLEDVGEPDSVYDVNDPEGAVWIDAGFSGVSDGSFQVPIEENIGSRFYFRAKAYGTGNLTSDWSEEVEAVVSDSPAPDVIDFTIEESVNDPKTPDGMYSTFRITVEEPDEVSYLYSIVEYRTPSNDPYDPDNPWFPISKVGWKFANQAEVTVLANGTQYELRVRSVSTWGVSNSNGVRKIVTTTNTQDPEYDEDNPFEALPVPNVRGLELFEQGNDTEFGGRDAKFVWRKSTVGDWVDLGYEGLRGAGASRLDQYFRDYQVEVWADNSPVRTEFVTDNQYTYTYEKNAEDYFRETGEVGAYREFEVRVLERGRNNQVSEKYATLAVANSAPKPLQNLRVNPGFNVIEIDYKKPEDLDFAGVDIWISTTQGFDPNTTDPFATVGDNSFVASGLEDASTYYIRLRPFDDFGRTDTNTSSEFTVTTKQSISGDDLSGWAYQIDPADRQFIEDNLEGDSIPSTKIENLTAAKLTAGVINATETITAEGLVRAVDDVNNPQREAGIGPRNFGEPVTYLMWAYNGQDIVFGVDELGNVEVTGKITIASGSTGVAEFSDSGNLATKDQADSGDVTFNYAGSSSKGGNASDTDMVNGVLASEITSDISQALTDSQTAVDIADGKIRSFYQDNEPTGLTGDDSGDLWIDTNDDNKLYRWDGSNWAVAQDGGISQAIQTAQDADTLAGTKIVTFFSATEPTPNIEGDLWYNTTEETLQRWNGTSWEDIGDITANKTANDTANVNGVPVSQITSDISQALQDAQTAQDTADNKIQTFYQDGEPTGLTSSDSGDLWIDTNDGNRLYRWDGNNWLQARDDGIGTALQAAQDAETLAGTKITTYFQSTEPTADTIGDLWYNTSDESLKTWDGTEWKDAGSTGADWDSTLSNIPDRISDNATTGLNITDEYIGYYNGTAFKTYIQNDGSFHFGSDNDNFIDYNGTQLVIETDNFSVDASGNATFSGELDAASGLFNGSLRSGSIDGNGDFTGFYAEDGKVGYLKEGDFVTAGAGNQDTWEINSNGTFQFSTSAFAVNADANLQWNVGGDGAQAQEPNLKLVDSTLILTSLDTTNPLKLSYFDGSWQFNRSFRVSGNFTATQNVTAYSDVRLKTDIEVIPDALNKVSKLGGYLYDRTDMPESGRQTGVLAQEILEVLPEAVEGGPTKDDPKAFYTVAQGNLVGLLIQSIKELSDKVDKLEKEVGKK